MFIEKPSFKPELEPIKKKKYTYIDHNQGDKVVFECEAKDILEADELYKKATGKNPEKQGYVGIVFKNVSN